MTFNRRNAIMLGAIVLLAGCKVIPKGTPTPAPPPEDRPTDALPADQLRHRVALLVPMNGPNADVGQSLANATTMALLDTNAQNIRITTYDTSAGPAAAANQAIKDGNKLILGPLMGDEVPSVATVARAARVPLISYASDTGSNARDVFAMGTILYRMLGGRLPFAGDSLPTLLYEVVNKTPDPLPTLRSDLPPRVQARGRRPSVAPPNRG
jgi:hypothetical protein